jgi:hypothetical protein
MWKRLSMAIVVLASAGAALALFGPNERGSEPPSAEEAEVAAGAAAEPPPRRKAALASTDDRGDAPAAPAEPIVESESSLQRELVGPERVEADAYPWEEFEEILGRSLTIAEREEMRDLRKEHGLRLAEARASVDRGDMQRAEFDAWRAERAQGFRAEVAEALNASDEEVVALLRVPLRSP